MNEITLNDLSIDCVIFGFEGDLKILLVRHKAGISQGKWALPGGFVLSNESLDDAASRILQALTGIHDIFLEQTKAFGAVNRFPTKRVVTIAYQALLSIEKSPLVPGFTADDARWFSLAEVSTLPYDHNEILSYTLDRLRKKIRQEPIGFNMLPQKFTLFQLQKLYESILNISLDKPNFRRKIAKMKLLVDTGEKQNDVSYRAAKLYRFDEDVYDSLKEKKFILDF
ncbi:MAG: NUDIX domain-containing protein [Bacteroidota bacterium]